MKIMCGPFTLRNEEKVGLRWWRDVLIRNQTKRYLDDRLARKYWFVSFRKTGDADSNGLKIRYHDVCSTAGASEHRWVKMRSN